MKSLYENMVLEWHVADEEDHYIERILWISPARDTVISIAVNDDKAFPIMKTYSEYTAGIESNLCKQIEWINTSVPLLDSAIEPEHLSLRDKSWDAIKDIVSDEPGCFDKRYRGSCVREAQERTGLHKSTIYRYLRRYWQGGKLKNALLPHYTNCGNYGADRTPTEVKRGRPRKFQDEPTGINIDEETKQLLRSGIRLFYNSKDKAPLKHAYQKTLEKFFATGFRQDGRALVPVLPPTDKLPTFGQYKYWFKKEMDLENTLTSRHGKKRFALDYRPILGSSTFESFGPGSRFQIDATIADVYLVSEYRREWIIGRPIIYIVIDVFSRYICGIYIGLEGPSWIGAMMALANTTTDKVQFCAQYDIDISPEEWASSHLPQKLTADRGELEGTKPSHLIDILGVDVENAPPYRADWKGIVEQQFRLTNSRSIRFIPGAIKERYRERGERDYRLDAKLTLREFTQIMIHNVLYHNNNHHMLWYDRNEFMVADEVTPVPSELWHWGVINRNGRLKKQPDHIVKLNLMVQGEATVTAAGIQFKGMHYSCDMALREQWFVKARAGKTWRVKVCYDPRSTNEIYLWLDEGRSFETCTLLEREERYLDKRIEEVEDLLEIERYQGRHQEVNNMLSKIELDAQMKAIVDSAAKKTNEAIQHSEESNHKRVKGTRQRRSNEKLLNREQEVFHLSNRGATPKNSQNNVIPLKRDEDADKPVYIPPADKLSKIKAYLLEDGDDE
ncbi:Mu transposase C-terminal domain-containing protein [Paenibacillus agilis]|uniref:DDE-type integrase/transposase/recombinase n=1 Tax=Paenibacillus agilis TaxID=3020863 RepID=A0A559IVI9_9BACL|nr:Mu transposase C-terminal domain-containing protein [Paenibacillus agilis]TVX91606.1 DDE-type integrase/transposase/recombinase [Paenibacillus agilis]